MHTQMYPIPQDNVPHFDYAFLLFSGCIPMSPGQCWGFPMHTCCSCGFENWEIAGHLIGPKWLELS